MNKKSAVLGLTLSLAVVAGCDRAEEPPGERFARSFDRAVYGEWIPESEVPETPRDGPPQTIWEATRYPGKAPTPAQTRAADDLRERCLAAARKHEWFEFDNGLRDGFERQWNDENHFYNWEYVTDDAILDPERPEYLMYYPTENGQVLAGFMFLTRAPMEQGPQPGGPLTVWHYHLASHPHCFRGGMVLLGHPQGGSCIEGVLSKRTPEMVHVWFLEHPEGHFATRMKLEPAMLRQAIAEVKGLSCCGLDDAGQADGPGESLP